MIKIRGSCTFNPLTPRNAQHVNSPHIFNEMSVRQVLRMRLIIRLTGVILNIIPNSLDYPTKKSMALVRRMKVLILGMKGLKDVLESVVVVVLALALFC